MSALQDRAARIQILEHFGEQKPHFKDYDAWIEIEADFVGEDEKFVRRVISDYLDRLDALVSQQQQSNSQRIADVVGATRAAALRTLRDGLDAVKPHTITKAIQNEDGSWIEVSEQVDIPDWRARLPASIAILNVHGSMAPTKIDVSSRDREGQMSDEELDRHIVELARQSISEGDAGTGENSTPVYSRPLLLDDISHKDKGRAGREGGRSLPSIPEVPISVVSTPITAGPKRGSSVRVQKQNHDAVVASKRGSNTRSLHDPSNKGSVPKSGRR